MLKRPGKGCALPTLPTAVFLRYFDELNNPRRHNVRHLFNDILTIAILAVMSRADDWREIHEYAAGHASWLKTFLSLPKGIPCADTFRRVFARIDPLAFERCFIAWTQALSQCTEKSDGRIVAIDGKTLRRSFQHAWAKQGLHLVSAWCNANELVLGQLAVEVKENEIVAIPKLLELLNLKGAIVTIDAMGCQKEIAQTIRSKEAHYVLAVKDNQRLLHQKVQSLMDDAILDHFKGMEGDACESTEKGHGRIETRRVWCTPEVKWLGETKEGWCDLGSVGAVECVREDLSTGKTTTERRYFISSLDGTDADVFGAAVRQHWGVENKLHWVLDVGFGEDQSRIRKGHGAENFSRLRRIVLNKLKNFDTQRRVSLKTKRYRCLIDPQYLIDALKQ
jgi:predicted transposase YbfD/YdcC